MKRQDAGRQMPPVIDPETGCSLDYTQLAARARAAAGWLGELGLGEGSKVVVAAGNSIAAVGNPLRLHVWRNHSGAL